MMTDCSLNYESSTWILQSLNMLKTCCVHKLFFVLTFRTICVHNMYWTCNSLSNLLSYCGLVDARISASDKDLPVSTCTVVWENKGMFFSNLNMRKSITISQQQFIHARKWFFRALFHVSNHTNSGQINRNKKKYYLPFHELCISHWSPLSAKIQIQIIIEISRYTYRIIDFLVECGLHPDIVVHKMVFSKAAQSTLAKQG